MPLDIISPYYYPTQVYMLDDNKDFLTNFSLQLNPNLAYRIFSSPQEVMRMLAQENREATLISRLFSPNSESKTDPLTSQTIDLNLVSLQNEVFNRRRFEEVSVLLVDYDMPSMNGLEFCQQIKHLPVKKIMLTGKADEKIAIEAFNKGIIHQFIQKQSAHLIEQVNKAVLDLQLKYFADASKLLTKLLFIHNSNLFTDPVFIKFFKNLCAEHDIVEYYLVETTGSFLLLTAQGQASWLVMKFYEDLRLHYEVAEDGGADEQVLEDLRSGVKVPFTWKASDYYLFTEEDWKNKLYPAQELKGKQTYYYAYIQDIPDFREHSKKICSYDAFLTNFDKKHKGSLS